jgi:hypothetical protein
MVIKPASQVQDRVLILLICDVTGSYLRVVGSKHRHDRRLSGAKYQALSRMSDISLATTGATALQAGTITTRGARA